MLAFLCAPHTPFNVGRMHRFSPLSESIPHKAHSLSMTLSGFVVKKLLGLENNYRELTKLLGDQDVQRNPKRLKEVSKEVSKTEKVVACFKHYQNTELELQEAKEMFEESGDADIKEMAREEINIVKQRIDVLENKLKVC